MKCVKDNASELGSLAEFVDDPSTCKVPKLFLYLSGPMNLNKIHLASIFLWNLFKDQKNLKAKDGECPFLEPNTQSTYIHTFLAYMKEDYGWEYSMDKDFNFVGGFRAKMQKLYAERAKVWPAYGMAHKRQVDPSGNKSSDIDLKVCLRRTF